MAVSNFKLAQELQISAIVDQLIKHVSGLDPSQQNFRIAEEYIMSNLQAHTFPDTNDNEMKRHIKNLKDKFIIHNQTDKSNRLSYLIEQFLKRKLKNNGGGFGEVHFSVIRMLLLLQATPTDLESIEEFKNNKIYRTKEEMQEIEDKKMEEILKIKTEEDKVIQNIQDEWDYDCQESSDDQFGSEDEDFKLINKAKQQRDLDGDDRVEEKKKNNDNDELDEIEIDDTLINKIKEIKIERVNKKQIEDSQVYFGGMPLNRIKAPIIKTVQKKPKSQGIKWTKPKKFNINAFLDKYLSEFQPPENPYYKKLKLKEREDQELKVEKQEKLRNILGVRTFDQLQEQLSIRIIDKDLIKNSKISNESRENQSMSAYREPLNLLRDFLGHDQDMIGIINYSTVTERQLVMDILLMLQQLESPLFIKVKKKLDSRFYFQRRNAIQMIHISPKMLEDFLAQFIEMGNIVNETHWYLKGLKNQIGKLGMVIESYVYIIEIHLQRFESEISDLQKIALYQAGQISTSQLKLNSNEISMISKIYNLDEPLTILRLKEILQDQAFRKVKLIHQVMRIGIMDYCIIEDDYNYMDQQDLSDSDLSNNNSIVNEEAVEDDTKIVQVDKIRPADRVTYLLNSLFLIIKNNQLLQNQLELNILKEIFIACVEPYIGIMADWIDKGELNDPKQEFFIKANPKVFDNQMENGVNQQKASSQSQWRDSFIFRTINLKELMGQGNQGVGPFLQAAEQQKVDVSIPIFLRPAMKEILSIGKSIKIIRYLDKISIVKSGFEEFFDFRQIYKEKLEQQLTVIKQKDEKFCYFDENQNQPNQSLIRCGEQNLNNIWDPSYKIGNIMKESKNVNDYRDLLNIAPFSWSVQDDTSSNGIGLFQIPQIQKNLDSSFASTKFSDSQMTPEKLNKPERLIVDFEMKSEYDAVENNELNNSSLRKHLIDEEQYKILSTKYNYSKQELMNYEDSLNYYQAFQTFDYLLKNPDQEKEELENEQSVKILRFKKQTIENFIRESLTIPIHQIYIKTCTRFVRKLNTQCKLQENIKTLRQIFFMEAGHQMHQYSTQIFKSLDKGKQVDNLYMINGHFNESVCQNLKGADFIEKIRVIFTAEPKNYNVLSINAIDFINLSFNSEWPLEIILDKDTINNYNMILLHLMKIKRVNYALSLKDYWIKPKANIKPYNQMTIKEQIMYKNKILLDKLMHQFQLTQKEFLHFSNNLEYYLKTRAIQQICNQLDSKLVDIQLDLSQQMSQNDLDTNSMIDMDALVQIHQDFLMNIMRLCLLDNKSKLLLDIVLKVLQICLSFRELCQKYFLRSESQDLNLNNYDGSASLEQTDDLGLNVSLDSDHVDEDIMETINKERDADKFGRGLLRIDNFKFIDRIEECTVELSDLRNKFTQCMQILIDSLKRYTKKGVFSYLDEAFTRFNFNNFYMSRDREGLD